LRHLVQFKIWLLPGLQLENQPGNTKVSKIWWKSKSQREPKYVL